MTFIDQLPIQNQPAFHADMARLNITETQFEIIGEVLKANNLQGIRMDPDGYLFCCIVSILGVGLFYSFPSNFKGVIFIGFHKIELSGNPGLVFDGEVL